jgi:hypothetical protein
MANPADFLDVYSDRVWNAVTAERPAYAAPEILATVDRDRRDSMSRTWVLEVDLEYMRTNGVTMDNIAIIVSAARMTVVSRDPNHLTVRLISGQFPPRLLVQRLVQAYRTRRANAETAAQGPTGQPQGPMVTQIFRQFPVWRAVKEERHAFTDEQIANTSIASQRQTMSRQWRLIIDATAISSQERLTNFLQGLNIPIIESTPTALVVEIPTDQSPSAYILSQSGAIRPLNQPRLLNEDEIRSILDVVPQVQGAVKETSQTVRTSIQLRLYEQLKNTRLTPLGIPDLQDDIVNRFERSRVHPGSMVGVTAAEALGGPITQMALNTFHVSGSSKNASYGVDAMRELLNVSKKRRHESCSIYFKNPNMTYDDVYAKRADIVGMTVADLVKDFDIDTPDNLTQYWWHTAYPAIMGRPVPTATWVMRLMLNVNVMYAYKVTMEQVVSSLELRNTDVQTITVIASPLSEGIIDIYPDDRAIVQPLQEKGLFTQSYAPLTFLTQIIRPELDNIVIQGIAGIRRLFPVGVPVWKIVREVIRVFSDADVAGNPQESLMRRMWHLVLNKMQMKSSGIGVANLQRLCEACGMEIQEVTPDSLVVLMPEIPAADLERENAKPPKERRNLANPQIYVQFRLSSDETETKRLEEEERKNGHRFFRRPMTELARAGIFYYADADGNNFQALLGREDIDPTHTVSNNVHENYRTLGIEAARTFMISEFITVITYDGSYINPRHITLLVDFMTNRGEPLAITFSGISRQATGTLGKASFEHAMDTFRDAAGFGTSEQIKSTSASIYVGKRAEIGTGYFDIRIDEQRLKEFQDRIQTQPQAQVDESALRAMIDRLGEISFGTEHLQYEDPEANVGFLLGEGTLPTTTPAPEVVIQEQGQFYSEPTAPIISEQLLGVYPTIATAPSLPEPATAVTTTLSTPVGTTPTIPLRGQSTHPLVSIVTTMEMTQPPTVAAQIEAPLAPRSQLGVAVVGPPTVIPAPVPPTTAANQPVPPTAGVPVPAPAPPTTHAPVPPPTAVNVAPIPPPVTETIITAGAPERQIQQARVRPIKAAAFLSSLRRGAKK